MVEQSFFTLTPLWEIIIVLVDYTEIPALLSASVLYLFDLTKGKKLGKSVLFLFFLNSQWLHIFWITDEFVVSQLVKGGAGTILPSWLAWLAIFIDYLEVPVIVDTIVRLINSLRKRRWKTLIQ
ncbi:hypothetical protein COU77_03095 [Candidatus Peregrinibacteria bacterium CG10_big_fil_rev_8_21_14_0_10_49_16]|nr:MAG: hypothetical protein COW95_02610 [Candidatus Peregrinibacteria bacterium CG22_combo_CG10-13_8_21_14_all_49_11]PIR52020.1 MAG: hypothetical protein COU77_03095 [Candidatus Peregrinibacteria bacterium CG10_big_fil_rev_8_21_14_0_10_49_16]